MKRESYYIDYLSSVQRLKAIEADRANPGVEAIWGMVMVLAVACGWVALNW